MCFLFFFFFFFKQKTAYEITYGDWSSDVCSSDLVAHVRPVADALLPEAEVTQAIEAPAEVANGGTGPVVGAVRPGRGDGQAPDQERRIRGVAVEWLEEERRLPEALQVGVEERLARLV